ncbi:MAG: Beta-hexosaminidase [Bryobacterales bacterium]|nr:Beta-hexosaminidase [Bryobacterales bacterium]
MPWPSNITVQAGGVEITQTFSISVNGAGATDPRVQYQVNRTFARLSRQTGIPLQPRLVRDGAGATLAIVVESRDRKAPQKLGDNERYSLVIAAGQAKLSADAPLGALRGIETFLQLVQQSNSPGFSVPSVSIHDEPRFPWRGLSLDVSRHFIPVENVKRTLDGMAAVKLNVLHWHLSDDQGFRVESKKEPRLQQFGSDGMYYTQADSRDVLAYARNRGIRIVPEFDMPGHVTSWLAAYPKLGAGSGQYQITRGNGILADLMDPTRESTYKFLDTFIGEMTKLFPDEYFHLGGDEVNPKQWNTNPRIQEFMHKRGIADANALQVYFNQRLLKIVTKHGKHMEGWDEVLQPDLPKSIVIQSWRGQESLWQAAREGYQGILSAGYYLDLIYPASYHYSIDPMKIPEKAPNRDEEEPADAKKGPAPGTPANLTPAQKKLVLGGEAAMWEEMATPENLDAKLWPRTAAIAERLWSPESITDPVSMYRRLRLVNHWLEWLGLTQRSNLELMRVRLAGAFPVAPLDVFASVLEPVRGYSRHSEDYTIFSSFNRLVDSISPESDAAREFRDAVDSYLAGPKNGPRGETLRKYLAFWASNAAAVRPMIEKNSLLNEDLPLADDAAVLCKAGQQALSYLDGTSKPESGWKEQTLQAVLRAGQRQANMRNLIAPAIQKLVQATSD